MRLQEQYKQILDESFSSHFKGWHSLSPFDPLKVLAEGLSASLSRIEQRHRHFVESLLDSLPALCGFSPKPAALPEGLLSVELSPRQTRAREIGPETPLRFQSESLCLYAFPKGTVALDPLFDLKTTADHEELVLSFTSRGQGRSLSQHFVPASGEQGVKPCELQGVSLEVVTLKGGQRRVFDGARLLTTNPTLGFTAYGALRIQPRSGQDSLFPETPAEVTLHLRFSSLPHGTFHRPSAPRKRKTKH